MADVFNNQSMYGGSFRANRSTLTFTTGEGELGGLGLLVQGVQGRYSQSVMRVFEIGPENRVYFIVGRAAGQIGLDRIQGPFAVSNTFVKRFGDACLIDQNKIRLTTIDGACDNATTSAASNTAAGNIGYGFEHCVLTNIGVAISAGDMVIRENLGMEFISMTD
jgi:hypothetical protein